ncbi:hypothetical protein OROMI_013776 [Orobanche minor]
MSHNQSRGQRSDSTQYRRTGRSGSSNHQRQFSDTKGGSGGSSAPTNPPNHSFKKYNSNAPVGQQNARNISVDSSNLPAARAKENGEHQQQPTYRVSDAAVLSTFSNVKPIDGPTQKITRAVPRAPSSYVSPSTTSNDSDANSESNAPRTPEKAPQEAFKIFPLQFGSISPAVVNGMQLPARTSSAPPNLDDQKKTQARHESLQAAHAAPVPSVPNQHLPKKDAAAISEQPNSAGETHQASKSKRDTPVSAAPPVTQAQKPSLHPTIPGMPMQPPFHQAQVPVQFGGPNPQIQSQASLPMLMPMPMPMSLPLGNPPVQHSMFVPGLQSHPMQTQGMMHQGRSLNFSPQMCPQLPPQLGSMGINVAPEFPQQPDLNISWSRKTVKITHPETHEELRLDSSHNSRLYPNVQSQLQPISSFPPNTPVNFYPASYNAASPFPPTASSVPLSSTPVPPTSQPPRLYSQVTLKPPVVSQGDKEPSPLTSSLSVGKAVSSKPSSLPGENLVFLRKENDTSSLSSLQQAKPGLGTLSASSISTGPNSIKEKPKKPGNKEHQDQVGSLLTSPSSLPSQMPEGESKSALHVSSLVSQAKESVATSVAASHEGSNLTSEGSVDQKTDGTFKSSAMKGENSRQLKPETIGGDEQRVATSSEGSRPYDDNSETCLRLLSLESLKITCKVEESSDGEVTSSASGILEPVHASDVLGRVQEERQGDDVKMHVDLVAPTESSVPETRLSVQDVKIATSDASSSVPHSNDTREFSVNHAEQESAPVLIPSLPEDSLRCGNEDLDSNSSELVSSPSSAKDNKILPDANVAKSVVPRGKKKKKDLYRKAEASGPSSDLYMAYKGPEEKKESVTAAEGAENSSSISEKQTYMDVHPENAVPCQQPAQSKAEPDDWEAATEISSPQEETSKNENPGDDRDGDELTTKRYSRDFLLKFVEKCADLPDGFELTSDLADTLLVSSLHISRELHPSSGGPGRNTERPVGGSRLDRRGSGLGDEDKWSKFPGPLMSGRGDMLMDLGYMSNVGFRPGQGGNYGVLRNPRAQSPVQYAGGTLSGPMMQSFGPQGGLQRNSSDSDRWQRGTGFHKGLIPSFHAPMQVMHKAEKKYEVGRVTDEEQAKQRLLKGILNKLTPQNFEKLFQQVKQVNIDNVLTLSGVISQIFDKALMEPTFCEMYANFCFYLAADLPELTVEKDRITFKRLLLNKCQEEFERGEREEQEANKAEEEGEVKQTAEEREDKRLRARRRMLGNIRLIGELYKKRMLTERIMHECINKLLGQYQNPDEENIEALCKLMSTIGEMIDHPKAKEHMDAYFDIMAQLSNNMKLSSRVRFMLRDATDLRKNKWQQRRKVEGPKKIEEVHRDAAQERHAQTSRLARVPGMGTSIRRGPPMEFAPKSPCMLPSPSSQVGGFRGVPPQLRGYRYQDVRIDERHLSENRTMPVPMPPKPLGDDSITLGPQGGLARGMAFRGQPLAPNMGSGQNGFSSMTQRAAYGHREEVVPRYIPETFPAPIYEQSNNQGRDITYGNRDVRIKDCNFSRSLPSSPRARDGQSGNVQNVSSDKVWPEEHLRDKSMATIKEFYSARDENEVALCIKDLNMPSFYPSMISIWVTDSFERKDMERDLLTKLLINLTKPQEGIISRDQLVKGFEAVVDVLEDAVNDAPKAAEFLGRILARVVSEKVIPLAKVGQLIYEGGEKQGQLVELGLAAEVLGSILDIIKSEKGDSVLDQIRSSSKLQLEKFRPPGSNKSLRIDKFL